jgi:hypothetical protein
MIQHFTKDHILELRGTRSASRVEKKRQPNRPGQSRCVCGEHSTALPDSRDRKSLASLVVFILFLLLFLLRIPVRTSKSKSKSKSRSRSKYQYQYRIVCFARSALPCLESHTVDSI